jgi:hypothetical protein
MIHFGTLPQSSDALHLNSLLIPNMYHYNNIAEVHVQDGAVDNAHVMSSSPLQGRLDVIFISIESVECSLNELTQSLCHNQAPQVSFPSAKVQVQMSRIV